MNPFFWLNRLVSKEASIAMAKKAYERTINHNLATTPEEEGDVRGIRSLVSPFVMGIGCTAALVSNYKKKGPHEAFISIWNKVSVSTFHVSLEKDVRTREEEDQVVSSLIINASLMLQPYP
jgi:hypothetical protein